MIILLITISLSFMTLCFHWKIINWYVCSYYYFYYIIQYLQSQNYDNKKMKEFQINSNRLTINIQLDEILFNQLQIVRIINIQNKFIYIQKIQFCYNQQSEQGRHMEESNLDRKELDKQEEKKEEEKFQDEDSGFSQIIEQIFKEREQRKEKEKRQNQNIEKQKNDNLPSFVTASTIKSQNAKESVRQHQDKRKHNEQQTQMNFQYKKLSANSKGSLINQEFVKNLKDLQDIGQKCGYGGGLDYKKRNKGLKNQTGSYHTASEDQPKNKQKLENQIKFFQQQKNIKDRLNDHMSKYRVQKQQNQGKRADFDYNSYLSQKDYNNNRQKKEETQTIQFKPDQNYVIDNKLIQTQKKISIQNIDVYFPYDPYEAQVNYMNQTILALKNSKNALLQSPTGTGKTLCLLSSTLSWAQSHYKETKQQVRIIYLSRTHSQIAQVQNQLKKTCYRPTMASFGSRQQLCIKQQLQQIKGREKVQACSKGIKLFLKYGRQKQAKIKLQFDNDEDDNNKQKTKNEYQNKNNQRLSESEKLQNFPLDQKKKIESAMCRFYRSQNYVLNLAKFQFKKKLITTQTLKQKALQQQFCPYYYPMHIKPICSLYFMPYNYLLDEALFSRYADILSGSIIIFDEGHNVPEASCQGRSYSIVGRTFDDAIKDLQKNINFPKASSLLGNVRYTYGNIMKKLLVQFKSIFQNAKNYLRKQDFPKNNKNYYQTNQQEVDMMKVYPPYMNYRCIYEMFYQSLSDIQANIFNKLPSDPEHIDLANRFVKYVESISNDTMQLCEALKETEDGSYHNIEKVGLFLEKCKSLFLENPAKKEWIDVQLNHYRAKINYNSDKIWQFQLVCLVPFLTFKQIRQTNPRSIIITSGTLSPLKVWTGQLRVPFPIQFSNTHVIKPKQLQLRIITTGVLKTNMLFSYQSLKNNRNFIYEDLIQTLCVLAKCIPNGILVIVPSYKIMNQIQSSFNKHQQSFRELTTAKTVFFQTKGQFQALIKNYKTAALKQSGALLFCVCRGKISQGIDFPNELCRSVIFIGVPYPNIMDPIINQKKDHLHFMKKKYENDFIDGNQWYDMNTIRAVNQAIGRVIRHINDYGTIFLIDDRYKNPKLKNGLSSWVHKSLIVVDNFNQKQICEDIRQFYKTMGQQYKKYTCKQEDNQPVYGVQKQPIKIKNVFDIMMSKKNLKKSAK